MEIALISEKKQESQLEKFPEIELKINNNYRFQILGLWQLVPF